MVEKNWHQMFSIFVFLFLRLGYFIFQAYNYKSTILSAFEIFCLYQEFDFFPSKLAEPK